MIGRIALALAACVIIASAAAGLVVAASFALFYALRPEIGQAASAACVAGAVAIFMMAVMLVASLRGNDHKEHKPAEPHPHLHDLVATFTETIKERPVLTLALSALTGIAATRDPNLLKDLWAAVLHRRDPHR